MFNLLLTLITGLIIGWNFHALFIQLTPPNIFKNDINISQFEKNDTHNNTNDDINLTDTEESFYTLLEKNLFSDAMAFYLESENKILPFYRATLLNYFKKKSKTNPEEAIVQMLNFSQLEPKNKAVNLELIKTYKDMKNYKDAIAILTKLIDNTSASEQEKLYSELIKNSQKHIEELIASKKFQALVDFLKERIELGVKTPFYTYSLAKYYVEIEKFTSAVPLLKEIEYDYDYGEKAKKLLALIQEKVLQNKEYTHQVKLKKVGDHFTIEVEVDNHPITLLLDTGATLTMINEEKLSSTLTIIKENIILNTAGGEINAKLQEADVFSVGGIELENFQIVSSSFEQKEADGLLGMNFFKKFKFKIDQEKSLLYLSKLKKE